MFDANKKGGKNVTGNIIKVLNTDAYREILRSKVIEDLSWDSKFDYFESIYK